MSALPYETPYSRPGVAAAELLLGAGVVIGHNVLHILPNEVPILVAVGLLSYRLRTGRWRPGGLGRPASWLRVVAIALAAAASRIALGELIIDPLLARFFPPSTPPAGTAAVVGNPGNALLALLFVWTFAAFGEEFSYRGYLLPRAAEAVGGSRAAYWCAVVVVAVLFGFGHYFKGPTGVIDSSVAGLILGAAYLLSGRSLWAPFLAHGLIDTVVVVVVYLGLQT
jgi:membrane protease YdiL (CAAX protease family)